jgi:hypothetical protein
MHAMSLFEWVRAGVRQAVVLGFADAMEDVGSRTREEDFGATLAQSLRSRLEVQPEPTVIESKPAAGGRRRLGRSISKDAVAAKAA